MSIQHFIIEGMKKYARLGRQSCMKEQIQAGVSLDLGGDRRWLDLRKKDNKCRHTKHKGELEVAIWLACSGGILWPYEI